MWVLRDYIYIHRIQVDVAPSTFFLVLESQKNIRWNKILETEAYFEGNNHNAKMVLKSWRIAITDVLYYDVISMTTVLSN